MAIRPWGVALAPGLLASLALTLTTPALADDDELSVRWGGRIQSDLRFRVERKGVGDYYNRIELPEGPERNWSSLYLNLDASYGRFKAVAQIGFVLDGFSNEPQTVGDLYHIEQIDPYRFEAPALYLDIKNALVDGLDLRIGQQVVSWGVGDQFNPTNNLNADDLRDPLLFGKQYGNFMVKADYWLSENVSLSGVMVPVFRPALLPRTAVLAPAAVDRLPFTDATFRHRVASETASSGSTYLRAPTVVDNAKPVLPEVNFENMQWAYRLAGTIAEQDLALSYYYGRTDFPVPVANHTRLEKTPRQCGGSFKSPCVEGLLKTDVTLAYPRMHVYGLNATGEIPLSWIKESLHGIGYRAEAALIVPDRSTVKLTQDALDLAIPQSAGEYDYDGDGIAGGPEPAAVENIAFLKWVIGLDYSFGEHVYVNAQWVHGIADEYGAGDFIHEGWTVRQSDVTSNEDDTLFKCTLNKNGETCAREMLHPRIGDYVVLGFDFKLMNNALLLRLFNILDVSGMVEERWSDEGRSVSSASGKPEIATGRRIRIHHSPFSDEAFSMVIYPEVNYNFGNGLELGAGALIQLGKNYTKFGDPAAGGSTVFTRGKFAF